MNPVKTETIINCAQWKP